MKKIRVAAILLITALMFSLSACGKAQDKISEKAAEGVAEKATGAKVDINTDGKNGVKIEKDGATFEGGDNLKWPKAEMGDVPEPKGKITAVLKDGNSTSCTVVFGDMAKQEATKYADKLKSLGYTNGSMTLSDQDMIMIAGENGKGASIYFTYSVSPKEGSITYSKQPIK